MMEASLFAPCTQLSDQLMELNAEMPESMRTVVREITGVTLPSTLAAAAAALNWVIASLTDEQIESIIATVLTR